MVAGLEGGDITKTTIAAVVAWGLAKLLGNAIIAKRKKILFEKVGTVDTLQMFPLKSSSALRVSDAFCSDVGLEKNGARDRHWMVVSPDFNGISMSTQPKLTLISCQCIEDKLVLSAPEMPELQLPLKPDLKTSKKVVQRIEKQTIPAIDCGDEAARWMSDFLQQEVRVVHSCTDLGYRNIFERTRKWDNTARPGDKVIFGFVSPYLVATLASLKELNGRLDKPVSMQNFRPNIIIKNTVPFDEDDWAEMRIGDNVLFHYLEPCRRCLITTVNPKTGVKDSDIQPLKHLKSFRCRDPYGKAPIFGSYMSNDVQGQIKIGDPVYVLRKREPYPIF